MFNSLVRAGILTLISVQTMSCSSRLPRPVYLGIPAGFDARSLPLFDGVSGEVRVWRDLQAQIETSDVIIVGEQHDDHVGHLFQQAVVEAILGKFEYSAVSMEMLERDEQSYVDDYLNDIITKEQFLKRAPIGWRPGRTWLAWYQPNIEAARIHGRRVVAANAPRRYVRLAKTGGVSALQTVDQPSAAYFSLSTTPSSGGYVERYREFFLGGHGEEDDDDKEPPTQEEQLAMEQALEASFRSQSLWDSTMAQSIVSENARHNGKVVHLVGQFHSDSEGGLVQQIRNLNSKLNILVISMQPKDSSALEDDDLGRGQFVVYTGKPKN